MIYDGNLIHKWVKNRPKVYYPCSVPGCKNGIIITYDFNNKPLEYSCTACDNGKIIRSVTDSQWLAILQHINEIKGLID